MFIKNLPLVLTLIVFTACSSGPKVQEYPDTANPTEELSKFDADMGNALANQVNVLSPGNYKHASASLGDARKNLDKQNSAKDTLHDVAVGRAHLAQAEAVAQLSRNTFSDVVSARQAAITAGAPTLLTKDFQKTDGRLMDVTADIEKNDLKDAKEERTELQRRYLDLELDSIKISKIGEARNMIRAALKEGAKDLAPRSLAQAEKSVLDTDAFITANRHDSTVSTRSAETTKVASHLLKITRSAKSGKKASPEDVALRLESEENKVASKQGELEEKDSQLDSKQSQLERKQMQLDREKNATAVLATKNAGLADEQAFNQRFEDARAEFTKNEAEVYKQGDTLTIRLRALEFPPSQAALKGSNFPLLAKVQKVINSFGKSSVVVEGHTDSVGGKAANEKLSSARADAVKEYLAANAGDESMDIKAVGYGYQKPLATNKTVAGRAQNRRVDILIHSVRQ